MSTEGTWRPRLRRSWVMLAALLLFLPPLSVIFQLVGEGNFCGQWCPRMFFVWREGATAADMASRLSRNWLGVWLVGGVLATTFLFGRYWCSHLCPVGGAMELGSRLVPQRLKLDFSPVPAPWFRYGYLGVYLLAPLLGLGSLCCSYCNFSVVPRLAAAPFSPADASYFLRTAGLINLGLILLLGFFARGGRAYCNLLCPVGALDAVANALGGRLGGRVRVREGRCDGCGACARVCPTWAIETGDRARVDQLSCVPCGKCSEVCPQGAIGYGGRSR